MSKPEDVVAADNMDSSEAPPLGSSKVYVEGSKLAIIMTSLWLGTMLVAIDNTILGVLQLLIRQDSTECA
jgi:hypothetical protein